MHTQFRKNLAKMMVFAISIPTAYTNASVSYEQNEVVYIDNEVNITTTTGSAIEIKPLEPSDNNAFEDAESIEIPEAELEEDEDISVEVPGEELEEISSVSVITPNVTTSQAINVVSTGDWDGINMIEPQLQGDVYYITCADELAWLENEVNIGNLDTTGITVQLQNDIDFNGHSVVIGNITYPFKGDFDGNGYTLKNIDFTEKLGWVVTNVGLFGCAEGGTLGNVTMEVAPIKMPTDSLISNYGGLVGLAKNIKEIKNVSINEVDLSINRITVAYLGGLIGTLECDGALTLENIEAGIYVSENGSSGIGFMGGVIGRVISSNTNLDISAVDIKSSVGGIDTTVYNGIGGLIGKIDQPYTTPIKSGSFFVDNYDTSIKFDKVKLSGCIGGITGNIGGINNIDVSNCNIEVDIRDTRDNLNYDMRGLLFSDIVNSSGLEGHLNVTNCHATGTVEGTFISTFICKLQNSLMDVYFDNCSVDIETSFDQIGMNYAGSMLSYASVRNIEMNNITNRSDLARQIETGGIIGSASANRIKLSNCENYGDIVDTPRYGFNTIGGLIGKSYAFTEIYDSSNYGNMSGSNGQWVGGLVASTKGVKIERCKNTGTFNIDGSGMAGGIVGYITASGSTAETTVVEIVDCETAFKGYLTRSLELGGLVGAMDCNSKVNLSGNTITGDFENSTIGLATDMTGGLVGALKNMYSSNFSLTVEDNTLKDVKFTPLDKSKQFGGLFGRFSGGSNGEINIKRNVIDNIAVETTGNNRCTAIAVEMYPYGNGCNIEENIFNNISLKDELEGGILFNYVSHSSSNPFVIKNNYINVNVESEHEKYEIGQYVTANMEVDCNLFLTNSDTVVGPYSAATSVKSGINYYNSDTRPTFENELFTPLTTKELRNMNSYKGFDFDNVWGFKDGLLEHPTISKQTYTLSSDDGTRLCIGTPNDIVFEVSHPSLLSSIEIVIEDEDIATIKDGEIVPLKEGYTNVIYRTKDLPLSEQLEFVQIVEVKDYKPKLELRKRNIFQGDKAPTADKFITDFRLVHPYDNALDKDLDANATYEIINIKDENGNNLADIDTRVSGKYTLTVKSTNGIHTLIQDTTLTIRENPPEDKVWIVPETKPSETVTEDTDNIVEEEKVTVSFKVNRDRWYLNGELMHHVMDKEPELKGDRAYIPIRFLSYALHVNEDNIKWDDSSKSVEIIDGDNKIELTVGSNIAILNGESLEMDGVPYISNGRIMLPISQIQGVFKNREPIVEWDQSEHRVDITLKSSNYKG